MKRRSSNKGLHQSDVLERILVMILVEDKKSNKKSQQKCARIPRFLMAFGVWIVLRQTQDSTSQPESLKNLKEISTGQVGFFHHVRFYRESFCRMLGR